MISVLADGARWRPGAPVFILEIIGHPDKPADDELRGGDWATSVGRAAPVAKTSDGVPLLAEDPRLGPLGVNIDAEVLEVGD